MTITGFRARAMRKRHKLNQTDFWSRVGLTQSCGSRYEISREIPEPIAKLIAIAYGSERECALVLREMRARA